MNVNRIAEENAVEKKLTKDEEYLQKKKATHIGKWLTMEAANEYYKRAQKIGP